MHLRFHWMLPKGGEVAIGSAQGAARYRIESRSGSTLAQRPDLEGWARFASHAEEAGIDSVLISFSRHEPEPLLVACALGRETKALKFIAAFRAGLTQPAAFVQQVNTLSHLIGGRISLNIVAGSSREEQCSYGDFLAHDERYERAEEFLAICRALWRNEGDVNFDGKYYRISGGKLDTRFVDPARAAPEVYVSGHSDHAAHLARRQGSCWLRVIDLPAKLETLVADARAHGVEICLRLCLICRPTRGEAVDFLESLLPEDGMEMSGGIPFGQSDSQMYRDASRASHDTAWLSRNLWTGFAPRYGPVWTTLVGSPDEIAEAFLEYKRIGVSQFIISGWPEIDEVVRFGREVLPRVRDAERRQETT